MKSVAIMQPTLMPWLGYFALMDSVDEFVYLDDVKFTKQSWQSRNRIKSHQSELMLSLRIDRSTATKNIQDVRFATNYNHVKTMKSLMANLGKSPYFGISESIIQAAYTESDGYLSRFNIGIIDRVAETCGITTHRSSASTLPIGPQEKALRLLTFCHHFDATHYLSPLGSFDYLTDANPFANSCVKLHFQNYIHPEYSQGSVPFLPYMACIDALSWIGPNKFLEIVRSGVNTPLTIEQLQCKKAA